MARKSVGGGDFLADAIRQRRTELNMTIEEASKRAGVGIKTWCRYEAGEPIRSDKCAGVCRAMGWRTLPDIGPVIDDQVSVGWYKEQETWSTYLEKGYGEEAALAFAIGSDLMLDNIRQGLEELAAEPKGTHVGQLVASMLQNSLPAQFLTRYDYEFVYLMYTTLKRLRGYARYNTPFLAHTVLEELLMRLIVEEARWFEEDIMGLTLSEGWGDWLYEEMLQDDDVDFWLYGDEYISFGHTYHFDRWAEPQFFCEELGMQGGK